MRGGARTASPSLYSDGLQNLPTGKAEVVRSTRDNAPVKKCQNCSYLWRDDYNGTCLECGAPMGQVNPQDLNFAYAAQIQKGVRENSQESAMKRGGYGEVAVHDAILDKARDMIVQKEEVRYEDE